MRDSDTLRYFEAIFSEQAVKAAMWLRCGAPDCSCQGAHDLPPLKSIDLIWHTPDQGELHQIHEEGTELDVIFDIFNGTMVLRQHVRKPHAWHEAQRVTSLYFNRSNCTFINLEGLADNSLLLTFKYHSPEQSSLQDEREADQPRAKSKKIMIRRRADGFQPSALKEGRLVKDIEDGTTDEMIMQLRVPHDRTMAWKTVALALLAHRQIDRLTWHRLASLEDSLEVAGFDWARIKLKADSIIRHRCNRLAMATIVRTETGTDIVYEGQGSLTDSSYGTDIGQVLAGPPMSTSSPAGCSDALHAGDLEFSTF